MIKKLKCHCGNVEAEVNIPDNGIENNEMQLFYLQKKGIRNWSIR